MKPLSLRVALLGVGLLGAASAMIPAASISPGARPEHPGDLPVLLVPGWSDTGRDLAALRLRLIGAGWPEREVVALTFREPTGDNATHALEIAEAVDTLLSESGADRVDIVAHSMGGLAARQYMANRGDQARVRRVVLLATPNQGTWVAYLAFGGGRDDMMPDSPFLASLNAGPPVPEGVQALTVRTPLDTHILPPESATLVGVPGVEVCCPTHEGLLRDADVFRIIRRFLADGIVEGDR